MLGMMGLCLYSEKENLNNVKNVRFLLFLTVEFYYRNKCKTGMVFRKYHKEYHKILMFRDLLALFLRP